MSDPDCLFCNIVAGNIPSTKVYEDDETYAFMDIAPAAEGHTVVVPKTHTKDVLEADPAVYASTAKAAQAVARRAVDVLQADGVNVLNNCGPAAWQTVFHLHFHVIPRYTDKSKDSLTLPWVPHPGDLDAIRAIGEKLAF
ncbi:HIT family protein [Nocardioides luteus]|uniref:HIT family protein n=1 Tax=Nocardioides luteus TaxID=1844 RepID=A0A1J4N4M1_9ACTN|nr:HIT family protein [Nocardioides luteus]EGD44735.1 HIT family protein [Nocardioidaceae bacterium Broad-1]MBG6099091.1 histidine triad (HIT) family protein [Nocardioides luteus]OIJ26474.1 HIT family protein [Nocardioides luteus]